MMSRLARLAVLLLPAMVLGQGPSNSHDQTVFASDTLSARPSKSIAIVGAGSGGIAILKTIFDLPQEVRQDWEVVLYDQRRDVGGLWLEDLPGPLPQPPALPESPVYPLLRTNTPHPTMTYPNFTYPPFTPLFPGHQFVQKYHYDYAKHHGLLSHIRLHHRVASANWEGDAQSGRWDVEVHRLDPTNHRGEPLNVLRKSFDHLIVANGHNHYPHVPQWEGTEGWLANTPEGTPRREIIHSIYYRLPEKYTNRTVVIIGAGASGRDASLQVGKFARVAYQSLTPNTEPTPGANVIPKPRISHFTNDSIVFEDGTSLEDVDSLILGTGYEFRVPLLSKSDTPILAVDPDTTFNSTTAPTLISNLRYIFPLYRHIFSLAPGLPATALAFIGLPVLVANCPSDIAQSLLVAHALADPSILPNRAGALADLVAREETLRGEGLDPYYVGHRLISPSETDHDYQDSLVEYLKDVGALPKDTPKFVEEWRRLGRAQSRLLGRGWERAVQLGQDREWLDGVETEAQWADLLTRLAEWQQAYEKEHGVPTEELVSYE